MQNNMRFRDCFDLTTFAYLVLAALIAAVALASVGCSFNPPLNTKWQAPFVIQHGNAVTLSPPPQE